MTETRIKFFYLTFILCGVLICAFPPASVDAKSPPPLSVGEQQYIRAVMHGCRGKWEEQSCLSVLASVSKHVASYYAEDLQKKGKKGRLEPLKQGCAASTAAEQTSVPAYAMKSAMTECANTISDIHTATGISPNVNMYQLIIAGILCLGDDPQCPALEGRLEALSQ